MLSTTYVMTDVICLVFLLQNLMMSGYLDECELSEIILTGPYLALINQARGLTVWENLDQGLDYRLNAVRPVHMTEVKILLYRLSKLGL